MEKSVATSPGDQYYSSTTPGPGPALRGPTPVTYLKDGNRYLVFASKGGADTNPDWYYNLRAHPDVKVEVGDDTIEAHAEEVTGAERDKIYAQQSSIMPQFAQYAQKTKRIIPVIALTPITKK